MRCRQAEDGVRWRAGAAGVAAGHEVAQPGQVEGQQRRHAGALTDKSRLTLLWCKHHAFKVSLTVQARC